MIFLFTSSSTTSIVPCVAHFYGWNARRLSIPRLSTACFIFVYAGMYWPELYVIIATMLRKVAALAIAWYAMAVILAGCCNCPPAPTYNLRWTTLAVNTYSYTVADNMVTESADSSMDFSANNLMIRAHLDFELITATESGRFSMINQAYACKCIDGFYHPEHALSSLKVISVNAFDNDHPAMSDVSKYFRSKKSFSNGQPDGLGDVNLDIKNSSTYEMPKNDFRLYLDKRPAVGGDHQFTVVLTLNDSSTIVATTPILRF
jgi:hypothetical protein